MKNFIYTALLFFAAVAVQAQGSMNMQLRSNWTSTPGRSYNDIWGYAANGREYAIIGSNWGTHFVDVTNPTLPVEVASFAGSYQFPNGSISWRDYKTYGNYVYAVADANNQNTLQIFNVANLPASVTKVYDSNVLSTSAHTVSLENDRLYLINNRRNNNTIAIDIFSLANPTNPTFMASVGSPLFSGMHAIHVRNDTAYCSYGFGGLFILDLRVPTAPVLVSTITNYPNSGYNHSSWTSGDRKTLIFSDEVPASLPVKVYNITDISNPVPVSTFSTGTFATPHNTFMIGNIAIMSYYKDGIQVWDLTNPASPVRMGYYDTYPQNDSTQASYNNPSPYNGAWGVYPFLPSGNILASDITNGLFVLSPPYPVGLDTNVAEQQVTVYPNPTNGEFSVRLPEGTTNYTVTLHNTLGQQVKAQALPSYSGVVRYNASNLASGLYTLRLQANGRIISRKVVIN